MINLMELFRIELYPWKGKFLLLRVFGPPSIYGRAEKEFLQAQKTIGPIRY